MPGISNTFRVDLRLLAELGERLISRDEVAIVEIVKNAYDADAKEVEVKLQGGKYIEVRDNGTGMSRSEILNGWLTIGTGLKKRKTKTLSGRRVLGEKGLGRLAVLRLGEKVTIYTKKKGDGCYRLVINWGNAKRAINKRGFTPVSKMAVHIQKVKEDGWLLNSEQGTTIRIDELRSEWTRQKINKLEDFLGRLVEPANSEKADFTIYIVPDEDVPAEKRTKISPPEITKSPHYSLDASVNSKGHYKATLKWSIGNEKGQEPIEGNIEPVKIDEEIISWKDVSDGGAGPFTLKLKVWDLEVLKDSRSDLRKWTGISLIRDNFRIVQPDVDWLGLNLRRVQIPTTRLSTNQLMGSVFISSDANPHIMDKTDREGVVDNKALIILKRAVFQIIQKLERKRKKIKEARSLSSGVILHYLDPSPLRQIARDLSPSQREIKNALDDYSANIDKFRRLLEEWILGRDRMATMGMLGAKLIHEARTALMKITDNYPLIEKYLESIDPSTQKHIKRMVEGGRALARVFDELDPFLRFRRPKKDDINLRKVVESLEFLFGAEIKKHKIALTNKVPTSIMFKAGETDIYVTLANLLDNAIYWLANQSDGKERAVEFRAKEKNRSVLIEVADSGPGINPDIAEIIFEAGVSDKRPEGTGLGLAIVKDIVEFYGGSIDVGEDKRLSGALFLIDFPYIET